MKAPRTSHLRSSGLLARTLLFLALLAATSCTPQATPTLFIPPTDAAPPATAVAAVSSPTVSPSPTASPTAALTPTAAACTNDLSFVQDVTVPDGTSVTPGESVDKQWLVTNTGTCNWDASYRLKLITGDAMGVPPEQALYPARAGTQATLRIVFTAPQSAGNYSSAWQAFAPDGTSFGQAIYIQINVTP